MITTRFRNGYDGTMPRTFTQLIDTLVNETNGGRTAQMPFSLKVDAFETPEAYQIQAAVPGFSKEQISIDLHEGRLTISGERKFERTEDQKFHLLETSYGRFSRTFQVPDNVKADAISASFENGMLRLSLPKDEQKVQRKKIEITTPEPTISLDAKAEKSAAKPTKPAADNNEKDN